MVVGIRHVSAANLETVPAPAVPLPRDADALRDPVLGLVSGLVSGETHAFGWPGIFAAAPAIAFAYIGFDVVATAAEETRDAPRVVPQGMIRSPARCSRSASCRRASSRCAAACPG